MEEIGDELYNLENFTHMSSSLDLSKSTLHFANEVGIQYNPTTNELEPITIFGEITQSSGIDAQIGKSLPMAVAHYTTGNVTENQYGYERQSFLKTGRDVQNPITVSTGAFPVDLNTHPDARQIKDVVSDAIETHKYIRPCDQELMGEFVAYNIRNAERSSEDFIKGLNNKINSESDPKTKASLTYFAYANKSLENFTPYGRTMECESQPNRDSLFEAPSPELLPDATTPLLDNMERLTVSPVTVRYRQYSPPSPTTTPKEETKSNAIRRGGPGR